MPFILVGSSAVRGIRFLWPRATLFLLKLICGVDYKVIGKEHIPKEGFIIAAKHQSALETFVLSLIFPTGIFILKKELIQIPFVGTYLKATNMIYVDRSQGKKAIQHMKIQLEKMDPKDILIIFPEGTRTQPGVRTDKYHSGVVLAYETLKWPVVPIALNTGLFWPKTGPIVPGTATIKILEPIYPHSGDDSHYDRRLFTDQLHKVIEEESLELYQRYMQTNKTKSSA